jgi:hypothetical protein
MGEGLQMTGNNFRPDLVERRARATDRGLDQAGDGDRHRGSMRFADITGHEVGGVCPFGPKAPLPIYRDVFATRPRGETC